MLRSVLLLFLAAASADEEKCGYASCTQRIDGMLNVHIVPHTHDDVGWLKTVDQYYYGTRNDIQKAGVQYILDSVVDELWKNPTRRFIYVETAYFWKWWNLQSEDTKQKVHTLVAEGRLKFAGGAWSANDEATTYYQSIIDQFTLGLSKLNETFGACGVPKVAWQIDSFGHSREFANMLAAMGYDGLFLGRIDYQDKAARLRDKRMEMIWIGDDTLGEDSAIFTSVLYNTYSAPKGFCFDVLCDDIPIIDDPNSPDYNVDEKVDLFLSYVKNMSESYVTHNVLVPMGGDFTYMQAGMWYNNLDKLIQYGNLKAAKDGLNMHLFYSTPDCYLIAVNNEEPWLPVKYDDFFPYASDPHSYWTGYYSSRPAIKYLEAQTNVYLQMVKQLQFLAQLPNDFQPVVDELKAVMGVMQHHNAVTGTQKQHVANDYVRMLTKAAADAHAAPTAAFNKIMNVTGQGLEPLVFDRCKFNESSCATSERGNNLIVTIYNPLAWRVRGVVNIPLAYGSEYYVVSDGKGTIIPSQLQNLPDLTFKIPGRVSNATRELTFIYVIPPLGYKSYYVTKLDSPPKSLLKARGLNGNNVEEFGKLFEDSNSGPKRLRDVVNPYNKIDDEEVSMLSDDPMVVSMYQAEEPAHQGLSDQKTESKPIMTVQGNTLHVHIDKRYTLLVDLVNYAAIVGDNMVSENRSSGAYVFRPGAVIPTSVGNETIVDGEIYSEVRLTTSDNGAIRCRVYKCGGVLYAHITYLIGPIKVNDNVGKEFGVKYEAVNVTTNGEFLTDSNGRQLLSRKLDKRSEWNLTLEEPVAGNYYPVVSRAGYKGDKGEVYFNILTDRAEGAASLYEGAIQFMMHRRLLHDDGFGVGEALNETFGEGKIKGEGLAVIVTHWIFLNPWDITYKDVLEHRLQPQIFISDASALERAKWEELVTEYSWLNRTLPDGIHLLTTDVRNGSLLLRLENCLEKAQEVDLANMLKNIEVTSVRESLLAANVWDSTKLSWKNVEKTKNSDTIPKLRAERDVKADDGFRIKVKGKQIRTFVVEYERNDF